MSFFLMDLSFYFSLDLECFRQSFSLRAFFFSFCPWIDSISRVSLECLYCLESYFDKFLDSFYLSCGFFWIHFFGFFLIFCTVRNHSLILDLFLKNQHLTKLLTVVRFCVSFHRFLYNYFLIFLFPSFFLSFFLSFFFCLPSALYFFKLPYFLGFCSALSFFLSFFFLLIFCSFLSFFLPFFSFNFFLFFLLSFFFLSFFFSFFSFFFFDLPPSALYFFKLPYFLGFCSALSFFLSFFLDFLFFFYHSSFHSFFQFFTFCFFFFLFLSFSFFFLFF
ncbi:unnamed protein product [Acanthosepion pharaonis]|uniref:Uncharacterized protein n=1 Tax=Acanthosepion pharaonis TaxID=158019 RepID=A0A812CSR6_ACAPH|nr:unnamed protein product [Sepia pharaonis]